MNETLKPGRSYVKDGIHWTEYPQTIHVEGYAPRCEACGLKNESPSRWCDLCRDLEAGGVAHTGAYRYAGYKARWVLGIWQDAEEEARRGRWRRRGHR